MIFFGERPGRLFWIGLLGGRLPGRLSFWGGCAERSGAGDVFRRPCRHVRRMLSRSNQRGRQKLNTLTSPFCLAAIRFVRGLPACQSRALLGRPANRPLILTHLCYMIALSSGSFRSAEPMGVSHARSGCPRQSDLCRHY